MIIDSLQNAYRYYSVHPLFQKAFEYISKTDLQNIQLGIYEVDGKNIRAIFSNNEGVPKAVSCSEFECHNQHIDIQVCINGTETFGWKPRANCILPNGDFDVERDVQIYSDTPDMFFTLSNEQFVVLFPEDVHAPMIGDGPIRKLVLKVKT